jgi:hypothetical protein
MVIPGVPRFGLCERCDQLGPEPDYLRASLGQLEREALDALQLGAFAPCQAKLSTEHFR